LRSGLILGAPLGCLALILIFSVAIFPYERFREAAADQLRSATGAQVEIGALDGGLSIGGPALDASGVQLRWADGSSLELVRARVRPAWSLSWLSGRPALGVAVDSALGNVSGTWWPGNAGGFSGSLREVDLAGLPPSLLGGPPPLIGHADAELDLRLEEGSPCGTVELEARGGSLSMQDLPMAIPYERLVGQARLGEGGAIDLLDVALDGPMGAATGGGSIGAAPRFALAPMDLDVELEVVDANLRPMVRNWGVRLDGSGRARLRITGSFSRPIVR
jgi:type II secretion system protein N